MNKFTSLIEEKLLPIAGKLASSRILSVLRDAFMLSFPLTIVGSLAVVVMNLPYLDKLIGADGVAAINNIFGILPSATMSIATLFVVIGIGYYLAKSYDVDAIFAAGVAVAAFLVLTPLTVTADNGTVINDVIPIARLGAKGMFVGIIGSFISTRVYVWAIKRNWTIKMPDGVPPTVAKSFAALIPGCIVIGLFLVIRTIFTYTPWGNIHDCIYEIIQMPLISLGSGLLATLVAIFAIQILWFFGLHGSNIVGPVLDTLYSPALQANSEAILIHNTEPIHAITRNIIDIYGMHGGSGSTLGLVIALMIFSKRQEHKELTKLVLAPSVFQINEPVIYGLPIVLDPIFCIPFILVPTISVFVGWFFTAIVPIAGYVYIAQPWVTPPVISAFVATGGSIGATVIAACTFIFSIIAYAPFVMLANKQRVEEQ